MFRLKKFLLALPGFQRLCRRLTRRHVRVFMYHRFAADGGDDLGGEGLRASVFRRQLRLILAHHPVWTPEQQIRARQGEAVAGDCPVVITADDGYHDYYDVAYPILRELGVPAALFVTTGFVDGTTWLWWDKLHYLGRHAPPQVARVEVAGQSLELDFSTPATRRRAVRFLINRSRFIADAQKQAVLAQLAATLQVDLPAAPPPSVRAMTWDQVREMAGHGLVFAPHTVTHPILTRIDLAQVDWEIRTSRDRLAEMLGTAGRVFAYPQGGPDDFDVEISRRVAAAGFAACYLAYQGPDLDDDDLRLPRYCAGECLQTFQWFLCGAEHLGNRARRLLGRASGPGERYWYGSEAVP